MHKLGPSAKAKSMAAAVAIVTLWVFKLANKCGSHGGWWNRETISCFGRMELLAAMVGLS